MNKILASFLGLLAAVGLLFAPSIALAQTSSSSDKSIQGGLDDIKQSFPDTVVDTGEPEDLVRTIIEWALYIGAVLSVIFIIIGGYQYIFSAGNDDQAKTGRKTITYALAGLVIIVLAWVIVQTVYNFLVQ